MPASIIRLTAFKPAPPTPTTLITARYAPASRTGARCKRAGCSGSDTGCGTARICGAGSGPGVGRGTGSGFGGDGVGSGRGDGGAGGAGVSLREDSSQLGT